MIADHLCGLTVSCSGRWLWLSFTICGPSMLITGLLEESARDSVERAVPDGKIALPEGVPA
jgi:hypothetical protein